MTRVAALLFAGALTLACTGGVNHRMVCSKVIQLRLGQSPEQVRSLIGEPRSEGRQGSIWSVTGKPRDDYAMVYGSSGSSVPVVLGVRDEMYVSFLNNRLVEVTAYRMRQYLIEHKEAGSGIMLGSRDYGNGPSPLFHEIGPAFGDIFGCGPDFSLENARAEFEVGNRAVP